MRGGESSEYNEIANQKLASRSTSVAAYATSVPDIREQEPRQIAPFAMSYPELDSPLLGLSCAYKLCEYRTSRSERVGR
eukprot:3940375-Rhodomonas_salina.5